MDGTTLALGGIAAVFAVLVVVRCPERLPNVARHILKQSKSMVLRVPLALAASSFLAPLVPTSSVGPLIGPDSGVPGVLLACVFGGMIPGGPSVTFPLALMIWQMGAGEAQMVALLAGWSIYAIHRIVSYELPVMGPRFVAIRIASAAILPPLAGFIALALTGVTSYVHAAG